MENSDNNFNVYEMYSTFVKPNKDGVFVFTLGTEQAVDRNETIEMFKKLTKERILRKQRGNFNE